MADPANPTLRVAYRLAEPGSATRCELMLNRDRGASPVERLVLKTLDGLPLPARVLDVFFETGDWLVPRQGRGDALLESSWGRRLGGVAASEVWSLLTQLKRKSWAQSRSQMSLSPR